VSVSETDPHEAMLREGLGDLMSGIEPTGFEIVRLLRAIGNQYAQAAATTHDGAGLSGPRWLLLLRLYVEEERGKRLGLPPGYLSRCQDVTKNTISVLLRGLEEKGWIERSLDPDDRRVFRIRLTPAGRELIRTSAPTHLAHLNALVDDLGAEEKTQLIQLLTKLHRSLTDRVAARATPVVGQP